MMMVADNQHLNSSLCLPVDNRIREDGEVEHPSALRDRSASLWISVYEVYNPVKLSEETLRDDQAGLPDVKV